MRHLGEHHAHGSAPTWKFLTAITVGQLAGWGAGTLARGSKKHDACSTQEATELFISTGVFWIVGGLTWVFLTKK